MLRELVMKEMKDKTNFIDLGLPSGTLWADRNIGAENITDHGFYFQYGTVKGYMGNDAKTHSFWDTCPGNGGASDFDETAITAWDKDNLTDGVLNADVDTAYVHTNGKAKMPTIEQFEELIDNTISELVTIDGVNGRKFTSKSNSSKYIFFPTSGAFSDGSQYYLGYYGYYWSSSANHTGSNGAQNLDFDGNDVYTLSSYRHDALSVRGVLV